MKGTTKKGKPRGLRRDRDCYTCRERNVKCDLNRPACTPCLDANLTCAGYPPRLVWSTEKNQRSFSSSTRASVSPTHGQFPALVKQASRDVLRRATSTPQLPKHDEKQGQEHSQIPESSKWAEGPTRESARIAPYPDLPPPEIEIKKEELSPPPSPSKKMKEYNNFQWGIKAILEAQKYCHEELENATIFKQDISIIERKVKVLDTVWKYVQSYLDSKNSRQVGSVSFELWSLQLKASAIEDLKQFINQGLLEAVFATLAFAYFDVSQGSFGIWHQHIQGARSLLDLHCSNKEQLQIACKKLPGLRDALTLLAWYDMASVVANSYNNRSSIPIFDDWHREVMDPDFFNLVGCSRTTFDSLIKAVKSELGTPNSITVFLESLNEVLATNHAIPTLPKVKNEDEKGENHRHESEDFQNANVGWQYTCLLTSLNKSFPQRVLKPIQETLVTKIYMVIKSLTLSSNLYKHIALPVFVASMNASKTVHVEAAREYWNYCSSADFPLYPDALGICEGYWEKAGITTGQCQTSV